MPRVVTWTHLAQSAEAGSTTLVLTHPVDWEVGEKIVVSSTGRGALNNENEEHEIAGKYAELN